MQLIALHQIATRDKAGGSRIIIAPNSRFDTADFPMVSEDEWKSMMQGEHPVVRVPDDPAFVVPAVADPVIEGRSVRTDLASQAAVAAARDPEDGEEEIRKVEDDFTPATRGRGRPRIKTDEEDEV